MIEISHPEMLYRTRNRLSLCGNIILFNSKPSSGTKDSGERGELTFCSLSFEPERSRFLQAAAGAAVIGRKTSAQSVEIVKCKCVTDFQKRVTSACVLVTQKSVRRESFKYTLLTLSSSHQLETRIEFKLPYELKGDDVSILQGPSVLWSHAGHVSYTSVQAGEVTQMPAWFSHGVVGELPLPKQQTFALQVQTEHNLTGSQTPGYFIQSGHEFDGTLILPHPYVCITKCMLVLSADRVEGALKSAVVVAATSNQQLVYVHNGIVKDVCPLPFEGPEDIQLVNAGGNGCLLVVSFHQGHVCAVWKETFQIASHWSGVSSVHVDDFLGCGTDQILLIFKDGSVTGQPLESFLITDLCGILYSRGRDTGAPKKSAPPESNLLTLQALESRLQSGLTVLQELRGEARVKERVLQQSVQALTDAVSDREPVLTEPMQEGLVALWECDDESKDEASDEKMQDTPAGSSKPRIDKLWHRIADDRIVVGLILTTDSSVPAASVSLSILTETGQSSTPAVIQTQSQVLCLPTPCPSSSSAASFSSSAFTLPEPAAKRSKQHNASTPNELTTCKMAVTAVTRLSPLLNSGCVKCHVMLHYVHRQGTFSFMSNPTPVVLHCGQVAVDIHSDFQTQLLRHPKLKTDEVQEDLLSLLALLDRWVFHIDSHDQSLGDIDGWIQKRVGCERIDVSPQYLLLNSVRPSSIMLLHWHQINPFCGELSVHSSQLQTLQFLDSLLPYLPVSCNVQPAKGTRWQNAAQIFSLALEKEVVSLRDCVSSLLTEKEQQEEEEEGDTKFPEPTSVEGLQRCRDVWQQDKKRIRTMLSPLVDMGRYRQLIQSMCKVQLDGDTAALLEIQRASLY